MAPASEKKDKKKPSIFERAFFNQYNYILLGSAGLFAAATTSWLPLLIGAGAEVLWMVLGADSGPFKRWVAVQESKEQREELEKRAADALKTLDDRYVSRFHALAELSRTIESHAKENPSLETRLVESEMEKLGRLLHSFLDMAVLHQRFSLHLQQNDEREIQRDIQRCTAQLEEESSGEVASGLRQNLELAKKRLKQHQRIQNTHRLLGVKMDTLDKSLRYLESHIIAIGKPEELSSELDGLIVGVESVEEMQREMDALPDIEPARRRRAAQAMKR